MATQVSEVVIAAPPEQVWPWLVEPRLVQQWQYGSTLLTDWTPGSEIRFRSEWNEEVFEQWGTVLEVDRPHTVRYTLFVPRPGLADIPENAIIMSYLLHEQDGTTLLRIVQEDHRSANPDASDDGNDDDGPNVLSGLKVLVEGAAIP